MANRSFQERQLSILKRVVTLYPVVKVGAAGAVTLQTRQFTAAGSGSVAPTFSLVAAPTTGVGYAKGDGAGVNAVTRTGAGAWTITLSDPYQYLIGVSFTVASTTGLLDTAALNMSVLTTGNVQTNTSLGQGGTINLVFQASGGQTATDPASGDIIYLCIELGDATEP